MAIDDKLLKSFQDQIDALKGVEKAVQDAIGRANIRLGLLNKPENRDKNIEDIFGAVPSKESQATRGESHKDHR